MQVHLPQDIIYEILLRIPAKFLTGFKAVCKLWFEIISNCQFVDKHLIYHQLNSHYVLVYKSGRQYSCLNNVGYEFINLKDMEDTKYSQLYLHQLEYILKDNISFKYSCDGLLLFQSATNLNQLYVCNPITRKLSVLPPHTTEGFEKIYHPTHFRECCFVVISSISWSLFRDGSIGQFMVVGITGHQNPNRCFVYTTSTDWTVFEIPKQMNCSYLTSTLLLNKELYLYSRIRHQPLQPQLRSSIYWLDVAEENIKVTQVPFQEQQKNTIIELKGFLCLTDQPLDKNQLDIWTLQNREKGIWSKDYSIMSLPLDVGFSYWNQMSTIFYSNQTRIVSPAKNLIFTYDLKNKEWKKFDFPVKNGEDKWFKCFHVHSLVKFI